MDTTDWEDLRRGLHELEFGMGIGGTELETMPLLIRVERQNSLIAIEEAAAAALDRERGPLIVGNSKVLQWKRRWDPEVGNHAAKAAGLSIRNNLHALEPPRGLA
jgi:hypothetical protein